MLDINLFFACVMRNIMGMNRAVKIRVIERVSEDAYVHGATLDLASCAFNLHDEKARYKES